MVHPYSRESLDYAEDYASSVPNGIAILFLLNFRDSIKVHDVDPKPTVFASADEYLAQKKGPVVTMDHVNAVIAKVRGPRYDKLNIESSYFIFLF